MESVNPNFVTAATSTTDLLETEYNVTEGTWGKAFCLGEFHRNIPVNVVFPSISGDLGMVWMVPYAQGSI